MSTSHLLDTNTVSLNELLSNGKKYYVPKFQRDYAWTEDEWGTLWEDIKVLVSHEHPHYMGAIVLQIQNSREFLVVDGQQRLATLSIVILSCIRLIQDLIDLQVDVKSNTERRDILMSAYIGAKDAASLNYANKLTLNPKDNRFFASTLVRMREPLNLKRLVPNEKRLWDASQFFTSQLRDHFKNSLDGEKVAEFVTRVFAEKLMFIQITVADQLNAYTVFETLNARGVSLTTADLLKNYLLSLMSESETDQNIAVEQWQKLVETTTVAKFTQFLLYFWNGRNKTIRASALYKTIRRSITTKEGAFTLLDELERSAAIYIGLKDPDDMLWEPESPAQRAIQNLKLFGVHSCYPLLMIAYQQFKPKEFERILRVCVIISFRANVIANRATNRQGDVYNATALKLFAKRIVTSSQVIKELSPLYLNDEEFKSAFATKSMPTRGSQKNKLIRYILLAIESQQTEQNRFDTASVATIEHIMPENLSDEWDTDLDEHRNFVYRLGNYTVLEKTLNKLAQNKSFIDKQEIYQNSQFVMSSELDGDTWSRDEIRMRQNRMAKFAASIWRVPQLH